MPDQVQMGGEPPVFTKDPAVIFLYLLLREEVSPGAIESRMLEVEEAAGQEIRLTNQYLAGYAMNIVRRLKDVHAKNEEVFTRAE